MTGNEPTWMPAPVVRYGTADDLSDPAVFEARRKEAIDRGMQWLKRNLVDGGSGGIREGLGHGVDPEGNQALATTVRTDCTG